MTRRICAVLAALAAALLLTAAPAHAAPAVHAARAIPAKPAMPFVIPAGCYPNYSVYGDTYDNRDVPPTLEENDRFTLYSPVGYSQSGASVALTGNAAGAEPRFRNSGSYGAVKILTNHWEGANGGPVLRGPGGTVDPGAYLDWPQNTLYFIDRTTWPRWRITFQYTGATASQWGVQEISMAVCWR